MPATTKEERRGGGWLSMQLLLDSALPVGSFAHSFGLESLVQDGKINNGRELRGYLEAMLRHSWAPGDLMVVKAVYEGENRASGVSPEEYAYGVEKRVHLQRLSPESRDGMEKIGRRLLKLAPDLFPSAEPELNRLREDARLGRCHATYPLVYGAVARGLGATLDQAAEGFLYASVSTCVNAALRLFSMGQTEAQRLTASLFPAISASWEEARGIDPEETYGAMPLAELAMIRHETLYSRLFMS